MVKYLAQEHKCQHQDLIEFESLSKNKIMPQKVAFRVNPGLLALSTGLDLHLAKWLDCRTCNHKVVGTKLTKDFTMTRINLFASLLKHNLLV